jgi:hypothetical protein
VKDEWDTVGGEREFVVIDGRKIDLEVYPTGFDFALIRGMNLGPNQPLYNYNNMVMEQHIVDEHAIVSKRPPFDASRLHPDHFRDTQHARFWNNKYRAQQQQLLDKKNARTPYDDSLFATALPSHISSVNSGHLSHMGPIPK